MKKYKLFIIIIFFVILIIPMIFINTKTGIVSKIDNQVLPDLSSVNDKNSLENYLHKRIGFREDVINLYITQNDKLFNKMVHPTYDYGKDGYVYFKFVTEELDTQYLDLYFNFVKSIQDYVNARGSYFVYVINPTKKTVQKDHLPKGYNYYDINLKYIQKKLKELNINYVDNTDLLIQKEKEISVFNKKYDAGHWNEYGAFYGIQNIFNKLSKDGIIDVNLDIGEYEIKYEVQETLPVSHFKINEKVPRFYLKKGDYDIVDISKNIMQSANYKDAIKTMSDAGKSRMLIFRGSYFNSKNKFISPYFKEVYYIHNYENVINFDYYYNLSNQPDIVIFTGVEYTLSDRFFSAKGMMDKESNPIYSQWIKKGYEIIKGHDINEFNYIKSYQYDEDMNFTNIIFDSDKIDYAYLIINDRIYDFTKESGTQDKFILSLENNLLYNTNGTIVFVSEEEKSMHTFNINSIKK